MLTGYLTYRVFGAYWLVDLPGCAAYWLLDLPGFGAY